MRVGWVAGAVALAVGADRAHSLPVSTPVASSVDSWQQLGETLTRERVVAISLDFSGDGFPAFAYGWDDFERGTRIPVVEWDGERWLEIFHRTSQFPQSYAEFDFKSANNNYYLGLKISERYGSVLNGGREWRGSYAFHNQLFDYQVEEPSGDMIMFWISEAASGGGYPGTDNQLVAVRYAASGWDTYPASPAFGAQVDIDRQDPGSNSSARGVSSLRIHKAGNASFTMNGVTTMVQEYVVAWVNDGSINVAVGSLEAGFVRQSLPDAAGITVNLAVGGTGFGSQYACIAYHPTDGLGGEVRVACSADRGKGEWQRLGDVAIEAADIVERIPVEIAITVDRRVFVAGRSELLPRELVVKHAQIPGEIPPTSNRHSKSPKMTPVDNVHSVPSSIDAEWTATNLIGEAPISHFELGASDENVYVAMSENFGQGLKVHQLTKPAHTTHHMD